MVSEVSDYDQIRELIRLNKGDLVEDAIKKQQMHLYKAKKTMMQDLEDIIRHDAIWTERASFDDYLADYPDDLEEWYETLMNIADENEIDISNIIYDVNMSTDDKVLKIEAKLIKILRECILKL